MNDHGLDPARLALLMAWVDAASPEPQADGMLLDLLAIRLLPETVCCPLCELGLMTMFLGCLPPR
jgi:hypothetical protein